VPDVVHAEIDLWVQNQIGKEETPDRQVAAVASIAANVAADRPRIVT
jgi:hypothetical protein